MSAARERVDPMVELARARDAVDRLQVADLTGLSDEALLEYARGKERLVRRFATVDHVLVLEIEGRDLPGRNVLRNTAVFLRGLLRLDPREAHGRVNAAHAAGARLAISGELVPPIYAAVAAAQAAGEISERHARIVVDTIEALPGAAAAEHGEQIETDLVGYAGRFDPHQLATLARRITYCYDQDGAFDDDDEQQAHRAKQRGISIQQRTDGSCSGSFEGTAEFAEFLLTTFDALAKPLPEIDGFKDPRTAAQRRHDALLDALKINVRARALPSIAGITATVVLTMTAEDFQTRTGLARTAHGALIPVGQAMRLTGNEYRLMTVVIDKTRGITAYSDTARLFTENQRLARAALDGGCTFPHCPAPPGWCELDHVIDWAKSRITRLDLAGLACRTHNNTAKKQGWRTEMINGRVGWIPPHWIDPQQRPQFNHLHDTSPPEPS